MYKRTYKKTLTESLLILKEKLQISKCPSIGRRTNKLLYDFTRESCDIIIKQKQRQVCVPTKDVFDMLQGEKTCKTVLFMDSFYL
jgi:hypothetical protein